VRHRAVGAGLSAVLLLAAAGAWPACSAATPVSGPHETVDNQFTTTQPGAPSGFVYKGTYHAAGDPSGDPPYMRKMVTYNPPGQRYDTTVPKRCTASDVELMARGTAACPAGSRVGGGTASAIFLGNFPSTVDVDVFNNKDEVIILGRSPFVASVARGRINPDASVEFSSPTCFPSLSSGPCPTDDLLQTGSSVNVTPYTRSSNGVVRSFLTTPPTCPAAGHWDTPIRFWWADGTVDTVTTQQPCTAP
jgi:hypothetical protein